MDKHPSGKDVHINEGGRVAGHGARFDCFESVTAVNHRVCSSKTMKMGISLGLVRINGVIKIALPISLPDFYQRISYGFAIAVKHLAGDQDALTGR
jgi:hypothetical protein